MAVALILDRHVHGPALAHGAQAAHHLEWRRMGRGTESVGPFAQSHGQFPVPPVNLRDGLDARILRAIV